MNPTLGSITYPNGIMYLILDPFKNVGLVIIPPKIMAWLYVGFNLGVI